MSTGWCLLDECPTPNKCKQRCQEADRNLIQVKTVSNHPDPRMNLDLGFSNLPKFTGMLELKHSKA